MPGRCNDRQRDARHDVSFCEHLLFVPWQIRKGTLGQAKLFVPEFVILIQETFILFAVALV